MSQEATMIAVDNSNYMSNGDFIPDRFVAQREAIYFVCNSMKRQNPENTCGLITLSNCQVLCTLTLDNSKIFSKISHLNPDGEISFCRAISIAHLALRNRQQRNQKPKIIIFIGSPIEDSDDELIKLSRKLKKEKMSVTIINFGEAEYNEMKLMGFINTINGKDLNTSQIISIPSGNGILEYLRTNPVIIGNGGNLTSPANDFEMDFADDPDLEYALRVSLEDQRMRIGQPSIQNITVASHNEPVTTDDAKLSQSVFDASSMLLNATPTNLENLNLPGMTEDEQISYAINASLSVQQLDLDDDQNLDSKGSSENRDSKGSRKKRRRKS